MTWFRFTLNENQKFSLINLFKWTLLAVFSGVLGTGVVHSFMYLLEKSNKLILMAEIPMWCWTVGAAVIVGGIIYRIEPNSAGEGVPSYIRGIRVRQGWLPFSATFFKFWAALLTLATFGNGGVVGPLGRVSAGIMTALESRITRLEMVFDQGDRRTAAICGMAAAIGAIFHSSIGGGIFAVEIIQRRNMGYRDLFPAILSSSSAVFFCKTLGLRSFYQFKSVDEFMDVRMIGWLFLLALATGMLGSFYTYLYSLTSMLFKRAEGNLFRKVLIGSPLAFFIAWFLNPELLGTSQNMVGAIFNNNQAVLTGRIPGEVPLVLVLVLMAFGKMVCNCITVGSGMSAGFAGPTVIAGMLLGMAMATQVGVEVGSPTYYAFLAAGFAGMLGSCMNTPLAAAVMAIEVFGFQYSFPAGFSAILGFQVTRHKTIYDYALKDFDYIK